MAIDKDTEELENVTTPLSSLDALQAQSQEQIASVTGIPLVVLLGVTPSGLNASSDGEIKTFYATVASFQEVLFRPRLQTVLEILQLNEFGQVDPDISFDFIPLWEMDEKDKATIRKSDADMDTAYTTAGIVSAEEVRERIVNDPDSPWFGVDLSAAAPELPDDEEVLAGDDPDEPGPGGKEGGRANDEWNESDHPRRDDGKFGSGGGAGGNAGERAAKRRDQLKPTEHKGFFAPKVLDALPAARDISQPVDTWDGLVTHGEVARTQFIDLMGGVAKKMGLRTDVAKPEDMPDEKGGFLFIAPNKSEKRAREKVEADYDGDWSQLKDMVRGSIVVDTFADVQAAVDHALKAGLKLASKPKDKFANPTAEGYRDLNCIIELPNGMLAEMQFHVKPMIQAKSEAHALYEEQRDLQAKYRQDEPTADWEPADRQAFDQLRLDQQRIYNPAWSAAGG